MNLKNLWLALAVIGAVLPYLLFIDFWSAEGLSPVRFVSALFANGAAGGAAADLIISSAAFWALLFARRRRDGGLSPWPFIAINLVIGLSCALPAWLWALERRKS